MAAAHAAEWKIKILPSAQNDLDELEDQVRSEGLDAIEDLTENPFPPDSILMRGHAHRRRIKFCRNQYRIVYDVSEKGKTVYIVRARHRRDAYRGL